MRSFLKLAAVLSALGVGGAQAAPLDDLQRAAIKGDAVAEFDLGQKFSSGEGIPKDAAKAFCWTHRAAEHGNPSAWLSVGMMYGMGDGTPKDNIESYKWFALLVTYVPTSWSPEIKQYAVEDAARIARQMSPAQVQEAKLRATRWWAAVEARGRAAPNQQYVPWPGDKPSC